MAVDFPLVEELPIPPDSAAAFRRISRQPHAIFLDSAVRDPQLGRYSFLAADPFEFMLLTVEDAPWQRLQQQMERFPSRSRPDLPPFQGGAAGLFGYDLGRCLEKIRQPRYDEFQTPVIAIGLYDVVLAIDHHQDRAWLISQGFPETDPVARQDRAVRRIEQYRQWLLAAERAEPWPKTPLRTLAAPAFPVPGSSGLFSNFTADQYFTMVCRAIEYIHAGDVFQVNLSQRLLCPATDDPVSLYLRLRQRNPAPFAAYLDGGNFQIVSASPERFVQVRGGLVETRPIKGTRLRSRSPEADLFAADELQASEKDRAENVMIVDLMRNDLSRVCRPDSIHVSQLCQLEVYAFVQHLVSAVRGELASGLTPLDLLRAIFPGGSVTGAPKVRAMEIIAELEPTARGAYCGALGYLGFDGTLDLNILIRTITAAGGWWQLPVGGGIVAQSEPGNEYEETWHKAHGLIRSLTK